MKLKNDEILKLNIIINKYKDIHPKLDEIIKKIDELQKDKNTLVNQLELLRREERLFVDELIKNYGNGRINLKTLEYEQV